MIGEYNKSVILTYVGIAFAVFGMYFAINQNINFAFLCFIVCGVCDLFDGAIARRCKRTQQAKEFGVQLDSLADVVLFLALPSVIAFTTLGSLGFVCIPYVIAGIIRLAWFNITTAQSSNTYFQGLPVTYSALIFCVFYLIHKLLPAIVSYNYIAVIYILCALAFVLNFKIKKPRGIAYLFFALLAIVVFIGILVV